MSDALNALTQDEINQLYTNITRLLVSKGFLVMREMRGKTGYLNVVTPNFASLLRCEIRLDRGSVSVSSDAVSVIKIKRRTASGITATEVYKLATDMALKAGHEADTLLGKAAREAFEEGATAYSDICRMANKQDVDYATLNSANISYEILTKAYLSLVESDKAIITYAGSSNQDIEGKVTELAHYYAEAAVLLRNIEAAAGLSGVLNTAEDYTPPSRGVRQPSVQTPNPTGAVAPPIRGKGRVQGDVSPQSDTQTPLSNDEPIHTFKPTEIVDDRLIEKVEKAQQEVVELRERRERYDAAEMAAREAREEAGKAVAIAGAKVLEAADTADVAAQRLAEKLSAGTGARIDAVRAAANVEVAESAFDRKERDYQEQQVRVGKLSLRSDILSLKAELKELEAESIELEVAKSQLHGIGTEWARRKQVESELTAEQRKELATLEKLFNEVKGKIGRIEGQMEERAVNIQARESALSEESIQELEKNIASEEDEYLSLANDARKSRSSTSSAILSARDKEKKLVEELAQAHEAEAAVESIGGALDKFTDSRLIRELKAAQNVKRQVLDAGEEILERRIEDAQTNITAAISKGFDETSAVLTKEELEEAKDSVTGARVAAGIAAGVALTGNATAETVKIAADAAAVAAVTSTKVAGAVQDALADVVRPIPYVGEVLHIGLHVTAGVTKVAGHMVGGVERFVGETVRGEMRINTEGVKADTQMAADAARLGLSDTGGLSLMAGMRHGEVERTIAFDRVGAAMTTAGRDIVGDILKTIDNIGGGEGGGALGGGAEASGFGGLGGNKDSSGVNEDGQIDFSGLMPSALANSFLSGLDETGVFEMFGDSGIGVRKVLGAILGAGENLEEALEDFAETTVFRAAAEGLALGAVEALEEKMGAGALDAVKTRLKVLQRSKDSVKVQSDYKVSSFEERQAGDFSARAEEAKPVLGYGHWFDHTGDREAAERLAAQSGPSAQGLMKDMSALGFNRDTIDADSGSPLGGGGAPPSGGSRSTGTGGDGDDDDDENDGENSATSMDGTGTDPSSKGFMRSPYGSLILGNRRNTGVKGKQSGGLMESLKGLTKSNAAKEESKAKRRAKKKNKKRNRVVIAVIAISLAIILLIYSLVSIIFLILFGAAGGWSSLEIGKRFRGGPEEICSCGCLDGLDGLDDQQSYGAGLLPGDTTAEKIWNAIVKANIPGYSDSPEFISGIMGNKFAEAGTLCPFTCEGDNRGAVNVGQLTATVSWNGFGLVQWTNSSSGGYGTGRRTNVIQHMLSSGITEDEIKNNMHVTYTSRSKTCEDMGHAGTELFDRALQAQIEFMLIEFQSSAYSHIMETEYIAMGSPKGVEGARGLAEAIAIWYETPQQGNASFENAYIIQRMNSRGGWYANNTAMNSIGTRRDAAEKVFTEFTVAGGAVMAPGSVNSPDETNDTTSAATAEEVEITYIGDSIGSGLQSTLSALVGRYSYFDSATGRTVAQGKIVLDGLVNVSNVKDYVVIELGTNASSFDEGLLEEMLESVKTKKRVVLVTPYVTSTNSNRTITEATAEWMRGISSTYPNVTVVDWNKHVKDELVAGKAETDLLTDGVHLTSESYEELAGMIAAVLGNLSSAHKANAKTIVCNCSPDCMCWEIHGPLNSNDAYVGGSNADIARAAITLATLADGSPLYTSVADGVGNGSICRGSGAGCNNSNRYLCTTKAPGHRQYRLTEDMTSDKKVTATNIYYSVYDQMGLGGAYCNSCCRGAMTAVRWSGADDNFRIGGVGVQIPYLRGEGKTNGIWEEITVTSVADLMPGDILAYSDSSGAHIQIFVGNELLVEMFPDDVIAPDQVLVHASIGGRGMAISGMSTGQGPIGTGGKYSVWRNIATEADRGNVSAYIGITP